MDPGEVACVVIVILCVLLVLFWIVFGPILGLVILKNEDTTNTTHMD